MDKNESGAVKGSREQFQRGCQWRAKRKRLESAPGSSSGILTPFGQVALIMAEGVGAGDDIVHANYLVGATPYLLAVYD